MANLGWDDWLATILIESRSGRYLHATDSSPTEPPPEEQFRVVGGRLQNSACDGDVYSPDKYDAKIRRQLLAAPAWKAYLVADEGLLEIDLNRHTVRRLLRASGPDLRHVSPARLFADTPRDKLPLDAQRIITLGYRFGRWNKNFCEQVACAGPGDAARAIGPASGPTCAVGSRGPGNAILSDSGRTSREAIPLDAIGFFHSSGDVELEWGNGEERDKLLWFDAGGKILRRETVVLPRSKSSFGSRNLILPALLIQSPVVYAAMAEGIDLAKRRRPAGREPWSDPVARRSRCGGNRQPRWVVVTVLCYRRQRAYGLRGTWCWTSAVFVFGIPGYLAYLAHRRWPARLPCPACGLPCPPRSAGRFRLPRELSPGPPPRGP